MKRESLAGRTRSLHGPTPRCNGSDSVAAWVRAKCGVVEACRDAFVRPGVAGACFLRAEREDGHRGLYIEFSRVLEDGQHRAEGRGRGVRHMFVEKAMPLCTWSLPNEEGVIQRLHGDVRDAVALTTAQITELE